MQNEGNNIITSGKEKVRQVVDGEDKRTFVFCNSANYSLIKSEMFTNDQNEMRNTVQAKLLIEQDKERKIVQARIKATKDRLKALIDAPVAAPVMSAVDLES